MSVAEFRRLFLIGSGFDASKIPPTISEEDWRELSLQALAGLGGEATAWDVITGKPSVFPTAVSQISDAGAAFPALAQAETAQAQRDVLGFNFAGRNVIYVSKGAAATDTRGSLSKYDATIPFATIQAAIDASVSGDVVIVGPGTFTQSTEITMKNGVSIKGAGKYATVISNSLVIGGAIVTASDNSEIADLSIIGTRTDGTFQIPIVVGSITGFTARNIYTYAETDGINGDLDGYSITLIGCTFVSKWDTCYLQGGSGNVLINDCAFIANSPITGGNNTAKAIHVQNGSNLVVQNSRLELSDSNSSNEVVGIVIAVNGLTRATATVISTTINIIGSPAPKSLIVDTTPDENEDLCVAFVSGSKFQWPVAGNVIGNYTDPQGIVIGPYKETPVAIGTVTTSHTLDISVGTFQTATLTASTACTFTMPTAIAGKSFTLYLKQAASTGLGTAAFTGVIWDVGGTPVVTPTAGKMDIFTFSSDGTNWYGSVIQGFTP